MGCNQSKAANGAVAQPPQPKSVVNTPKPASAATKSVQPASTEAIQANPTASPTNSTGPVSIEKKEEVPPCNEVKISSDFSIEDAPAQEEKVVTKEETSKPVVETTKEETVVAATEPAAIAKQEETATAKGQETYDDAIKVLEDALLVSPRNATDGKAPTTTTVTNEEAVKELEDSLRRVRSEEKEAIEQASVEKKEAGKPKEEVAVADEEATENIAPAATATGSPKKNIPETRKCAKCDAAEKSSGAFKTCAKCRDVYYCNKACQKAHFKVHKKTCCKAESKRDLLGGSTNLNPIQVNN